MRKIEPKMIEFLDAKLAAYGAAQNAIAKKDARSLFIYVAEACVGIRESGGNNKGPMVELIQETIGVAQGEAWCMSFVQTLLAYAELKTGIKSPVAASEHCLTVWRDTPTLLRIRRFPAAGAIAIWRHGRTQSGHTGIMTEWLYRKFEAIEGNTEKGLKPDGAIERDGGGVYMTLRGAIGDGSMEIVGFLKPF